LGIFDISQITEMPADDFDAWFHYFEWKSQQEKKAMKKAQQRRSMKGR
jgi:hypothetical protein